MSYESKHEMERFLQKLPTDTLSMLIKLCEVEQKKRKNPKLNKSGTTYDICSIPSEIKDELEHYDSVENEQLSVHLRKWIETVRAMPRKTAPLPLLDKNFLARSRDVWKNSISGLDEIYDRMLTHIVQYLQTGRTRPILLVGSPGCGKTHVMRMLGEMMGLPVHFASANQLARGNGLCGIPKSYVAAAAGEPVEAMVRCKSGTLIFAIDEVDKVDRYTGNGVDLQSELLTLTSDESAHLLKDNFLGFTVDASHLFVVMTANYPDRVSEPLKSRCDIVTFPEPTQELIREIVTKHTVPQLIDKGQYQDKVTVRPGAVDYMVKKLYAMGIRDPRVYQSIAENALHSAFRQSIESEKPVTISGEELIRAAHHRPAESQVRPIGFSA